MNNESNPFLVSGYKDEKHFCNRKKETEALMRNASNGVNTTLFSVRRIGKTGLIKHLFYKLGKDKKTVCMYVDIYATKNLKEFTNSLATAIYQRFPQNRGIGKRVIDFIKSLRPIINFDPLNGNPEISLTYGQSRQYEQTIEQLFKFIDKQKIRILLAIDEFQQIVNYPEKNTEALLRTYIQPLKNVSFIFSGSHQKIMHEMFNSAKRPFYASCSNLNLNLIHEQEYFEFIERLFNIHKIKVTTEAIHFILEWTCGHTFYTQFLCNRLFSKRIKNITLDTVHETCNEIHNEQEGQYFQYRNLLTNAQWNLLSAIAKEEKISKLHSKEFLQKHGLGTVSTISRNVESLTAKELIYRESRTESPYYTVNDKFLMRWLQRK